MGLMNAIKDFFRKKDKLRVIMIDEVGRFTIQQVTYDNNTFSLGGMMGKQSAYIVDHNAIYYDKKSGEGLSAYYRNNPNPIQLTHERNPDVDAVGFKNILDSKVIQDLFSQEGVKMLTVLLIIVICIAVFQLMQFYLDYRIMHAVNATMT